jgi:predicted transcriptional regulator of viral defense system
MVNIYKKTLGKISANLITHLFEEKITYFSLDDVVRINSTNIKAAKKLVFDLVKRKVIARIKRGRYIIIPQELGNIDKYIGNYYIAAREVINSSEAYVSFYSAMNYWGMLTQPLLKIFVVSPQRQRVPQALVNILEIIYTQNKHIWGINEEWVTKTDKVRISNIEKTIVDSLAYPIHSGGITEIAKGIWLVKDKIDFQRLCNYVERFNKYVVGKRLGYILEVLNILNHKTKFKLIKFINKRYDLFDPNLPKISVNKNQWHLIDNIGKEAIINLIRY